jgi:hypothetical protein
MTKKEREAERRQTRDPTVRAIGRGARPAGRARLSAFHRGSHQGALAPFAQLQARLPGTWQERMIPVFRKIVRRSTGVTRARLSQSRESTSRTGRSTGEHDAQSCPGADCIGPRAGTALAPLPGVPSAEGVRRMSEIRQLVTAMGTDVKIYR